MKRIALLLLAALCGSCASWLPAPTPMHTITKPATPGQQARCLLVLFPGMGDSDEDFVKHGFPEAIHKRKLSVDVMATNATLGYYARRTLRERIRADVMAPAQKLGYQEIWVAGISMGGIGSLLIAKDEGPNVKGVILLAPYLGNDDVIEEIEKAGGVAKWDPGPEDPKEEYDRTLWRWLKTTPEKGPPIILGAGDKDKLGRGHKVLSAALPPERLYSTPGGHDWGPWSMIWSDILDKSEFKNHCSNGPTEPSVPSPQSKQDQPERKE